MLFQLISPGSLSLTISCNETQGRLKYLGNIFPRSKTCYNPCHRVRKAVWHDQISRDGG